MNDTPYTLGIEEEYLLVDLETGALAEAPAELMEACAAKLESQVSPEFLQCQIEIGTRVCKTSARRARTSSACAPPSRTAPRNSA
jgi:carboxylate-amine ligase